MKKSKFLILFCLMISNLKAEVITLADQHQIIFDKDQWEYVLSEDTFQKSLGLLEAKSNENIKGIIDTEIRFSSHQKSLSAVDLLKEECQNLRAFWDSKIYDVKFEQNRYCLIEQKAQKQGLVLTQVVQAKRSNSSPHMFFLYSWTFHTQSENLNELRSLVQALREMQP